MPCMNTLDVFQHPNHMYFYSNGKKIIRKNISVETHPCKSLLKRCWERKTRSWTSWREKTARMMHICKVEVFIAPCFVSQDLKCYNIFKRGVHSPRKTRLGRINLEH